MADVENPNNSPPDEPSAVTVAGDDDRGSHATPPSVSGFPHFPALDGVRGISVATVLVFHGGFSIASGGFLGVSTFFTLSGFLITSLLLAENTGTGTIALGAFWKRRFKRLLPAAIACIGFIAVFWSWLDLQTESEISAVDVVGRIPGDLWAGLFYVYNWRAAFPPEGAGYNAVFEDVIEPSPAAHFWSLSIEEQFYVFFPLLAAIVLAYLGRSQRVFGWVLAGLLALSAASVFLVEGFDRIYNGTDVRAAEILLGALLAVAFATPRGRAFVTTHAAVRIGGLVALGFVVWLWYDTTLGSEWLLQGGLIGYGLLSVVVIMAATQATGPVAAALSWGPLRWLGAVSYGIYLYHWPIFRWVDESTTGLDTVPLFVVRMAVTLAMAWLSYHYLEQPIRRGTRPGIGVRSPAIAAGVGTALAASLVLTYAGAFVDDPADDPIDFRALEDELANATTSTPTTSTPITSTSDASDAPPPTGADSSSDVAPSVLPSDEEPAALVLDTSRSPVLAIMGDSVARNIQLGLAARAEALDLPPLGDSFTQPGCLNTYGDGKVRVLDQIVTPCRQDYDGVIEILDAGPDAFVIVGSTADLLPYSVDGESDFVGLTDPDRAEQVQSQLEELQNLVLERGISLVWVTVPCIQDEKAATMGIDPADVTRMNAIIYDLIDGAPPQVALYDLYEEVCPTGEYDPDVFGETDGRDDGLHFTPTAAGNIAIRIGAVTETVAPVVAP